MAKRDFARSARVAQEVQRLLNNYLQRELNDEALRLISFNHVDLVRDLSHAKVYWRSIESDFDREEMQERLDNVSKRLRHLLSQEMRSRTVPQLKFLYDTSIDNAAHIDSLLEKTRELSKRVVRDDSEE